MTIIRCVEDAFVEGTLSTTRYIGLFATLTLLSACGGSTMQTKVEGERLPALNEVSKDDWGRLAQRRIFFAHQSVGTNILSGVTALLATEPQIRLTIQESKSLDTATSGLVHARVGRNGYPLTKLDEFVQLSSQVRDRGVAMVKLCYVDIDASTDAGALFAEYRRRVDELQRQRPGLTIVHFTMPLTVSESWKGKLKAAVLRRPTLNVVRNRYNTLLRQAYAGREPVFDLARLESTLADGRRTFYQSGSDTIDVLAPEYTDDGAHLNDAAQRRVAEQFLIMLARLGDSKTVVASGAP
jgi:hypothetical protein